MFPYRLRLATTGVGTTKNRNNNSDASNKKAKPQRRQQPQQKSVHSSFFDDPNNSNRVVDNNGDDDINYDNLSGADLDDHDNPERYGGVLQHAMIFDLYDVQKEFDLEVKNYINLHMIQQQQQIQQQKEQRQQREHDDAAMPCDDSHIICGNIFRDVFQKAFISNRLALLHRNYTMSYSNHNSSRKKTNKNKTPRKKYNNNNASQDDDDPVHDDNEWNDDNDSNEMNDDDSDNSGHEDFKRRSKSTVSNKNNPIHNKTPNSSTNEDHNDSVSSSSLICHLQPSHIMHAPSYTQLIYASCFFMLHQVMMKNNNNNCHHHNHVTSEHAFPIFCLYALYETNPLPEPLLDSNNTATHDDSLRVGNSPSPSKPSPSLLSKLPMGYVNRQNPKLFYRHHATYRTPIRIDMKHYIYLMQLYEMCHITIHSCHYHKLQYELQQKQRQQEQQQQIDGSKYDHDSKMNESILKCHCGVAQDVKCIITKIWKKQYTMFEFCSYTGPCSLEGYAGHTDHFENKDEITAKMGSIDVMKSATRKRAVEDHNNKSKNDESDKREKEVPEKEMMKQTNPKQEEQQLQEQQQKTIPSHHIDELTQCLQSYVTHRKQIRLPIVSSSHDDSMLSFSNNQIKRIRDILTPMFPAVADDNAITNQEQRMKYNTRYAQKYRNELFKNNNNDDEDNNKEHDGDYRDTTTVMPLPITKLQHMIRHYENDEWFANIVTEEEPHQQQEHQNTSPNVHVSLKNKRQKHRVSFGNIVMFPSTRNDDDSDRNQRENDMNDTNNQRQPSISYEIVLPDTLSHNKVNNSIQRAIRTIIHRNPKWLLVQKNTKKKAKRSYQLDGTHDLIRPNNIDRDLGGDSGGSGNSSNPSIALHRDGMMLSTQYDDKNLLHEATVKTMKKKSTASTTKKNTMNQITTRRGDDNSSMVSEATTNPDDITTTTTPGIGHITLQTLLDQALLGKKNTVTKKKKSLRTTMAKTTKIDNDYTEDNQETSSTRVDDGTIMTNGSMYSTVGTTDDDNTTNTGMGRTALQNLLDLASKKPSTVMIKTKQEIRSKSSKKEITSLPDDGTTITSNSVGTRTTTDYDDDTVITGIGRTALQNLLDQATKENPITSILKTKRNDTIGNDRMYNPSGSSNIGVLFLDALNLGEDDRVDDDDDGGGGGAVNDDSDSDSSMNLKEYNNLTNKMVDLNELQDDDDSITNFSDVSYDGDHNDDDDDDDYDEVSIAASRVGRSALDHLLRLAVRPGTTPSDHTTRKQKKERGKEILVPKTKRSKTK